MSVSLTKEDVENIKKYRYETDLPTFWDKFFDPYWSWCQSLMPESISPNKITFSASFLPIIAFIYNMQHDFTMGEVLPY